MDSGFDVDRAAIAFSDDQYRDTPLYCSEIRSTESEEDATERYMLCRKHLLQAGADPTIGYMDVTTVDLFISEIESVLSRSGGYVTVVPHKTSISQKN